MASFLPIKNIFLTIAKDRMVFILGAKVVAKKEITNQEKKGILLLKVGSLLFLELAKIVQKNVTKNLV